MANLTTLMATINICGIISDTKISLLNGFIQQKSLDIVFLQEVSVPHFNFYGYQEIVNMGPDRRGTAILYKDNLPISNVVILPCGRGISAKFGHVNLVNVYAPSGSQKRQERAMFFGAEVLPLFCHAVDDVILAGDFNCVLREADTTGRPNVCGPLRAIVEGYHLKDLVIETGRPVVHTFRNTNTASRLDRFYISDRLVPHFKSYHEHAVSFSDHLAVACHINLGVQYAPRGPSYWKLNNTVLKHPQFLPEFKEFWKGIVSHQRRFSSIADWWEKYAKRKIQTHCRVFTSRVLREGSALMRFYEQALGDLVAQPPSPENAQSIKEVKESIVRLRREKLQGTEIYSKCNTTQEGEMATMYHAIRRHKRARSRAVHSMENELGEVLCTNKDLLDHAKGHFEALFAHPAGPSSAPVYLHDVPRILQDADVNLLVRQLTAEELEEAVLASPRKKSPGPDGLPAEFYIAVWEVIKDQMLLLYTEMLEAGKLCTSMTQGIIVLVPKVANPTNISQYRPITLLNVDYKILARVLNKRVTPLLKRILHPMQVGPGTERDITASLCDIRDVISHQERLQESAVLVSADLAGAFNNVHHEYLLALFEKLGFGPIFVKWARMLYYGCTSRVEINGFLSAVFSLHKSVRQGGPESMTWFVVAMRPLIAKLHSVLSGITLDTRKFAVSNYVDDTQAVLRNSNEVKIFVDTVNAFGEASGLRLNVEKSKALALGSWDVSTSTPFPYVSNTRVLGVVFSPNTSELPALNWPSITASAAAVLRENSCRDLCIEQRVRFVNTFAMSKLWYVAKVVPPHLRVVQGLRSAAAGFIWRGWLFRVAYPVLCSALRNGGFGLHDPVLRCKALFYSRWLTLQAECPSTLSAAYLTRCGQTANLQPRQNTVPGPCWYYEAYKAIHDTGVHSITTTGRECTRQVYSALLPVMLPSKPRITSVLPNTDWNQVWGNIQSKLLLQKARSLWFAAVHDIFATNVRLHAIGRSETDKCKDCHKWDTVLHRVTTCGKATDIWAWTQHKLIQVLQVPPHFIQQDLPIRPDFKVPGKCKHNTAVWLTGHVIMAVLGAPETPTLNDVIENTLKPIRRSVLAHSDKYVKKHFDWYLEALF